MPHPSKLAAPRGGRCRPVSGVLSAAEETEPMCVKHICTGLSRPEPHRAAPALVEVALFAFKNLLPSAKEMKV